MAYKERDRQTYFIKRVLIRYGCLAQNTMHNGLWGPTGAPQIMGNMGIEKPECDSP